MDDIESLLQHAGVQDVDRAALSGTTFDTLVQQLSAGRPRLISSLKELGVEPLTARQKIANALGRYIRTGTFAAGGATESTATESTIEPIGPAPPGAKTVSVRCAGALGGELCPLNNKLRNTVVHTKASTVGDFYKELQAARGYAMDLLNVRIGVHGTMLDVDEVAETRITDGMSIMILGPNRGG